MAAAAVETELPVVYVVAEVAVRTAAAEPLLAVERLPMAG